jgi:uncharacterized membrane protein
VALVSLVETGDRGARRKWRAEWWAHRGKAMNILILGMVIFLGIHSVSIVAPQWRNAIAARIGEWPWKGIYAIVAIAGFVLLLQGYSDARLAPLILYVPPAWLRQVAALLMLPAFVLLLSAYLPGRIKVHVKHPMLLAAKLWATAHLLTNGTVADVILFGGFLAWAVVDRISVNRRPARVILGAPASKLNDAVAVIGGLALYWLFAFHWHALLIGVTPFG